ncbi:uncharacterized protein PgNI_01172, partial [Pyricularia grisea]|uniref:Uncharacterized protein n=1 Tax=Pyricularia grisea TaxID=148305 RepID=A0A6P8BJ98_PYRGI
KRSLAWVGTAFPERTPLLPQGISADLPANLRVHSARNHQSGPLKSAQSSPTQGTSRRQNPVIPLQHDIVLS